MGQKVDKEGLRWTVGGIERQDGAERPYVWSPVTGKGATRPHAHSRVDAWTASCRRKAACDGACVAGCWLPAGLAPACRSASCASKSVVSDQRRASRKVAGDGDGGGGGVCEKEIRRQRRRSE